MILPHDADKKNQPKDAKAFGLFVLIVVISVAVFICNV